MPFCELTYISQVLTLRFAHGDDPALECCRVKRLVTVFRALIRVHSSPLTCRYNCIGRDDVRFAYCYRAYDLHYERVVQLDCDRFNMWPHSISGYSIGVRLTQMQRVEILS